MKSAARILYSLVLFAGIIICISEFSPIFNFAAPIEFSGKEIFDPYSRLDTLDVRKPFWKKAAIHTHTRVKGPFNECRETPAEVAARYRELGYGIITFSNHNLITENPAGPLEQVNLYEHGYNLFKYHKLVFGSEKVNRWDCLLPILPSQRQWQIDLLGKDSDLIQLNHPLRVNLTSKSMMEKLSGYDIIELDSGISTENEYWDWALSAGRYSFALASDDLHHPELSGSLAIRCSFLNCNSPEYPDILDCLRSGCYYCMRVPDYGNGDRQQKMDGHSNLPEVKDIGLDRRTETIYISLSRPASKIEVTGENHSLLASVEDSATMEYTFRSEDPYARITAYFPTGEVLYTNTWARYDGNTLPTTLPHPVNWPLTILWNLLVCSLIGLQIIAAVKVWSKRRF